MLQGVISYIDILFRTSIVYVLILIGLRLAGKRELGQMTLFDLVLLLLHGKAIQDHLRQEGLDEEILETALREHGVANLEDVEMAVLEIDGSISIVPKQATTHRVKHPLKYLRH